MVNGLSRVCYGARMNRRNFIGGLLSAVAGFSILPAATTHGRIWRAARPELQVPASFEVVESFEDFEGFLYNRKETLSLAGLPAMPAFGSVVTISHFEGALSRFNGEWMSEGGGKLVRWPIHPHAAPYSLD